ncbi:histidine kinase [Myroides albus]|uniref:histidine kinase n=1 Tax=Myroides albus TaxID=2562892 RepID=UPI002158DE09|nr:histidine kinase [Myroides albus]UVD80461.1 histidine kinase [Myroides albus]
MALYYDLGPLYREYNNDKELVRARLIDFLLDSKKRLKKIKKGIDEKEYAKVEKHIKSLKPSLEFLGVDQAIDEANQIEEWTLDQGKTKEVKEIFKSFQLHVKNARKEIKKDFDL